MKVVLVAMITHIYNSLYQQRHDSAYDMYLWQHTISIREFMPTISSSRQEEAQVLVKSLQSIRLEISDYLLSVEQLILLRRS